MFGKASDFFGAYWHDRDFGMARYSTRDDKAGKKIWIWGLSQQGMIWERLLTDDDGQYVEVQSGRLFNQAAPESSRTPFKNRGFAPGATDSWTEYWMPVEAMPSDTGAARTHVQKAQEWPEHLGAGKPYDEDIDHRLDDWIASRIDARAGAHTEAEASRDLIIRAPHGPTGAGGLVTPLALADAGRADAAGRAIDAWTAVTRSDLAAWGQSLAKGAPTTLPLAARGFNVLRSHIPSPLVHVVMKLPEALRLHLASSLLASRDCVVPAGSRMSRRSRRRMKILAVIPEPPSSVKFSRASSDIFCRARGVYPTERED